MQRVGAQRPGAVRSTSTSSNSPRGPLPSPEVDRSVARRRAAGRPCAASSVGRRQARRRARPARRPRRGAPRLRLASAAASSAAATASRARRPPRRDGARAAPTARSSWASRAWIARHSPGGVRSCDHRGEQRMREAQPLAVAERARRRRAPPRARGAPRRRRRSRARPARVGSASAAVNRRASRASSGSAPIRRPSSRRMSVAIAGRSRPDELERHQRVAPQLAVQALQRGRGEPLAGPRRARARRAPRRRAARAAARAVPGRRGADQGHALSSASPLRAVAITLHAAWLEPAEHERQDRGGWPRRATASRRRRSARERTAARSATRSRARRAAGRPVRRRLQQQRARQRVPLRVGQLRQQVEHTARRSSSSAA